MTGEPTTDTRETDAEVSHSATARILDIDASDSETAVLGVGGLALVAAVVEAVVTVLANVPFDPTVAPPSIRIATDLFAVLTVIAALVTVAVADGRATVRVGLLFAAVFGALAIIAPGTTLTAVAAVSGGAALALVGTLGLPREWTYCAVRRRIVAAALVAAVALTLAGVTGLLDGFRNLGAFVTLAAIAAVGTRSEGSRLAAGAGLIAVVAVVVASTLSPFVLGSTLLVVFGVTGVPHILVALAVAGAVAAAVAGLSRGEYALAVGAVLLLLAGVPATFPRAMTLLLGATLVLLDVPERTTEVAR